MENVRARLDSVDTAALVAGAQDAKNRVLSDQRVVGAQLKVSELLNDQRVVEAQQKVNALEARMKALPFQVPDPASKSAQSHCLI